MNCLGYYTFAFGKLKAESGELVGGKGYALRFYVKLCPSQRSRPSKTSRTARISVSPASNCSHGWIRRHVLDQERIRLQERDIHRNLVPGASKTGRVGDDGHQGAVNIPVADANHQAGPDLLGHAEIEQPDLTASRRHSVSSASNWARS